MKLSTKYRRWSPPCSAACRFRSTRSPTRMAISYTVRHFLITNHSHTRSGSSYTGKFNPTLSLTGTDSFWMEEGDLNTLGTFDQHNFNIVTPVGNYNTSVSTQLENPEHCGGIDTVNFLVYKDEEVTRGDMSRLAEMENFWQDRQEEGGDFRCQVCQETCSTKWNFERHLKRNKTCKQEWETLLHCHRRGLCFCMNGMKCIVRRALEWKHRLEFRV